MASMRRLRNCEAAAAPNGVAASTHGRPKPKLRNSCHACSISKLKCPAEKPTCSRCAKRSLNCEYFVAKPGGRKPRRDSDASQARRRQADGAVPTNHSREADHFTENASAAPAYLPLQHDAWFHLPVCADSHGGGSDALHSPDALLHHQSLSPRPTIMGMDLDIPLTITGQMNLGDCFSPPMSFTTERTDFDFVGTAANLFSPEDSSDATTQSSSTGGDSRGSHKDLGSLPFNSEFTPFLDDSTLSELFAGFTPGQDHFLLSTPSLEGQHDHRPPTPSQHSCFARALQSLEKMSSESYLRGPGVSPTAAHVIAENEAIIEDVGSMLECSCSKDGYLLYIAALIMSKALDCYSYAVRQSLCSPQLDGRKRGSDSSSSASKSGAESILEDKNKGRTDHSHEGVKSARMTAQLVLGELYLVHRLVGKLSDKLKGSTAGDETDLRAGGMRLEDSSLAGKTALPCLPTMGDHFAEALARRLKALSSDITHHLRAA